MTYWQLETESWEHEDNWDGAKWMEERGRKERLERIFKSDYEKEDTE